MFETTPDPNRQKNSAGVLVIGHTGRVINKLSGGINRDVQFGQPSWLCLILVAKKILSHFLVDESFLSHLNLAILTGLNERAPPPSAYRGNSLIRNCHPLGPQSRPIPRALGWS